MARDAWVCGKLPEITGETKQAARECIVIINERLMPAPENGIKTAIYALLQHFFVKDLPEQVHQMIATDWLHCLNDYPSWAIEKARLCWLQSSSRKPSPADIVSLCSKAVSKDRAMRRQCEAVVDAPLTSPSEPEITQEEQEAMQERISDIVNAAKQHMM